MARWREARLEADALSPSSNQGVHSPDPVRKVPAEVASAPIAGDVER
jgi:hypothetical protein